MDKENKLDIKIYESSKVLSDIGAGIVFSSRSMQILKEIGLGDKIMTILPENVVGKGQYDLRQLLFGNTVRYPLRDSEGRSA